MIIKNNPQAAFLAAHRELKDHIGEQQQSFPTLASSAVDCERRRRSLQYNDVPRAASHDFDRTWRDFAGPRRRPMSQAPSDRSAQISIARIETTVFRRPGPPGPYGVRTSGDGAQSNRFGKSETVPVNTGGFSRKSGQTVAFKTAPAKGHQPQGQAFRATKNDGRKIKWIGADAALN